MLSRVMTRKEQAVLLAVAVAVFAGSAALMWSRGSGDNADNSPIQLVAPPDPAPAVQAPEVHAESPAPVSEPVQSQPEPRELVVSVQGAVRTPGVYRMAPEDRVQDLIDRGGGALETAVLDDINLAAPLIDGTTLTVPGTVDRENGIPRLARWNTQPVMNPPQYTVSGWSAQAPAAAHGATGSAPAASGGLINLNTATADQLETLPGVGPVTAQSIIQHRAARPFQRIEELMDVRGIGPKKFEAVRELVTAP